MKKSEILQAHGNFFIEEFKRIGVPKEFIDAFENKIISEAAQTIANEEI